MESRLACTYDCGGYKHKHKHQQRTVCGNEDRTTIGSNVYESAILYSAINPVSAVQQCNTIRRKMFTFYKPFQSKESVLHLQCLECFTSHCQVTCESRPPHPPLLPPAPDSASQVSQLSQGEARRRHVAGGTWVWHATVSLLCSAMPCPDASRLRFRSRSRLTTKFTTNLARADLLRPFRYFPRRSPLTLVIYLPCRFWSEII